MCYGPGYGRGPCNLPNKSHEGQRLRGSAVTTYACGRDAGGGEGEREGEGGGWKERGEGGNKKMMVVKVEEGAA